MKKGYKESGKDSLFFAPAIVFIAVVSMLSASSSCSIYTPEQDLDPSSAEFLSRVRYLITREERAVFLELPDSERAKFIDQFWMRRDPDSSTEENELRTEYFDRVSKADELFAGEARPGWLTDRGRIYILYGPPGERRVSAASDDRSKACQEIWFYRSYPLTFVDASCSGTFLLLTLDLTPVNDLNISRSPLERREKREKESFAFTFSQTTSSDEAAKIEGLFVLEIPFERIWLGAEGNIFKTTLQAEVELREGRENLGWSFKRDYEIEMSEAELKANRKKNYRIEIPFVLTQNLDKIRTGKAKIQVVVKNKTGPEEMRKTFDFGKSN